MNLGSLLLSAGIVATATYAARGENCITSHHSLKYYEELDCIPTKDESKNCITSFNCSSVFTRKEDKCYYHGKEYSVGDELDQSILRTNCIPSCRCTNSSGRAEFSCPHVDCPENFQGPLRENCRRTYSHESCCAVGTYCNDDHEETKVAKCEYGGTVYTEGSLFYPDEKPCKKCICKPGFDGTLDSPWCEDIFCDVDIHHSHDIQEPCAPVYYGNNSCCPIYYHCQSYDDSPVEVVGGERGTHSLTQKNNEISQKCKFGNMTVEYGQKITPPEECMECSCSVPPFISCIVDSDCKEKQRNVSN